MDFCNSCGYMLKIEGICSICSSLELQYNSHLPSDFCIDCGYLTQNTNSFRCQACDESKRKTDSSRVANGTVICKCEFCQGNGFREIVIDIRSFCLTNSLDANVEISKWNSDKENAVSEAIRESWKREQNMLKAKMILEDSEEVSKLRRAIEEKNQYGYEKYYVGGMEISYIKGDDVNACAALVILSFPSLEVVYEDYKMIELTAPYIPGFLAFREASFLVDRYHKLISTHPYLEPTVIFVDGNGLLHPREFGVACHVGVLLNTPCLGVAKNLIHLDAMDSDANFKTEKLKLKKGDVMPLIDNKNDTLGMALRSLDFTDNPMYISSGHLVSLDTAVILVKACCRYTIPEPLRQADLNSRAFLFRRQIKSTFGL